MNAKGFLFPFQTSRIQLVSIQFACHLFFCHVSLLCFAWSDTISVPISFPSVVNYKSTFSGTFISFIVMVLGITWPVAENFEAQQLMIWRPAASNDSKDLFWWALYSSTWWTALPWTATAVKPAVSIPHCTGLLWQECRVDLSACCKKNSGANVWLSR